MTDYSFTLDGDGSQEQMNVYNDGETSTVTITITEALAGSGNTNYYAEGYGPGSYVSNYTDTFNFIIPDGWTISETITDEDGEFGGSFNAYVYDADGTFVAAIFVTGGAFGTVTPVCFTRGAAINTPDGLRAIETLQQGDLVLTRDHGAQPIRWIGSSKFSGEMLRQFPDMRPVRLTAGTLGDHGETLVSPAHRMLLTGWRADLLFGEPEVLATARSLINDTTIRVADDLSEVEYFHILFDGHEIISADGAWSESFHPAALNLGTASEATRDEVLTLFPDLEGDTALITAARPSLRAADVQVLF